LRHFRLYRLLYAGLTIIAAVLRFWFRKPEKFQAGTGRSILRLATHLGGGFVKLGQVLGARRDFLPEPLVEPLRTLHDRVPPRPFAKLRPHVERELGRPLDEVFAHVDETALAAASLAQVHAARLKDGTEVVLKIQYPEARRLFPTDTASLRRAVRVARWLGAPDLRPLVDELTTLIRLELDFSREAASTERVRVAFGDDPRVQIPRIHAELSTDRLLVLERVEGIPLSKPDALREAGIDLKRTAQSVAGLYATMIFEHGFFHGDPHPGNLLVAPDGHTIVLLDFGLATELPAGFGDGAAAMISNAMRGYLPAAVEAARSIGFTVPGDPAAFADLVRMLMGDYGAGKDTRNVVMKSGIKAPPQFVLIGRVMILLNGLSHLLVPGERVIAHAVLAALLAPVSRATQSRPA
jgi:ubiquinone biosynthesis protein